MLARLSISGKSYVLVAEGLVWDSWSRELHRLDTVKRTEKRDYLHNELLLERKIRLSAKMLTGKDPKQAEVTYLTRRFHAEHAEIAPEPGIGPATPERRSDHKSELRSLVDDFIKAQMRKVEEYWRYNPDKVRTDRAISKEIWEERPYVRWPDPSTKNDSVLWLPNISAVQNAYKDLEGGQSFMGRLAR